MEKELALKISKLLHRYATADSNVVAWGALHEAEKLFKYHIVGGIPPEIELDEDTEELFWDALTRGRDSSPAKLNVNKEENR